MPPAGTGTLCLPDFPRATAEMIHTTALTGDHLSINFKCQMGSLVEIQLHSIPPTFTEHFFFSVSVSPVVRAEFHPALVLAGTLHEQRCAYKQTHVRGEVVWHSGKPDRLHFEA